MTTYYISTEGNDSNNGLGPDASNATNKPWLTIGKAMNTGSGVLPGDIIYIGPGYYYGSGATPIASISSVGSPTQFIGDPTNKLGFKNSSGVLIPAGIPVLTTRTVGDGLDGPISTAANMFTVTTNGVKGLQFSNLMFEVQHTLNNIVLFNAATNSDITFTDCRFHATTVFAYNTGAPTAGRNFTLRRCELIECVGMSFGTATAAATADADMNILMEECLFIGGRPISTTQYGTAGGNIAGGVYIYDCTIIGQAGGVTLFAPVVGTVSTVKPIKVGGCIIFTHEWTFNAGTAGQIIDDGYNRIFTFQSVANTYTNTTQAGTSIINPLPNLSLSFLVKWGLSMPREDFLGWTDAAHANQKFSAYSRTTPDFRGKTARPWSSGSSIGCWQVPSVTKDTGSAITGGSVNSLKISGAGEISIFVPVTVAITTTFNIRTKSSSYGGTSYPQMIVIANGALGINSDATATATDANEATISTSSFTPTVSGMVEVRLISRSTSSASSTYFDLFTVA